MSAAVQMILLGAGALLLLAGLARAIPLRSLMVGGGSRTAHLVLLVLIAFFLAGYLAALGMLAAGRQDVLVALSTVIFAGGAVFVVITVELTRRIAVELRALSQTLEQKVDERTRELAATTAELEATLAKLERAQKQPDGR